jgi:hypothetical protein
MTTGYVYDEVFLKHDLPGHPENRTRLEEVLALSVGEDRYAVTVDLCPGATGHPRRVDARPPGELCRSGEDNLGTRWWSSGRGYLHQRRLL